MCDSCDFESVIEMITEMAQDRRYDYAAAKLEGIKDWVELHQHATEKQTVAVENIFMKPSSAAQMSRGKKN